MTSEEIVAAAPADHKRKLDEVSAEAEVEEKNANGDDDTKRVKLDDGIDELAANANGHQGEKSGDPKDTEQRRLDNVEIEGEVKLVTDNIKSEENNEVEDPLSEDGKPKAGQQEIDNSEQPLPAGGGDETSDTQEPENVAQETEQLSTEAFQKIENDTIPEFESSDGSTKRKMEIPNNKVGVLIGKAGETIRSLQYNSGAKIQIARDVDADMQSTTRSVEIYGTWDHIEKAEKLINAVIAEADAGGSAALVAKGLGNMQTAVASEQIEIQVPNEKVGPIIGKGGEIIKGLQTRSGARIQVIPQHHPEGGESKHRTVRVTGNRKQVEMASDMIKEIMTQNMRPLPVSSNYYQQMYRPRGPTGPPHRGAHGPYFGRPTNYDYPLQGSYPPQNTEYSQPSYGSRDSSHHPQLAPRSSYGFGWEQRPNQNMQGLRPLTGGHEYYSGPSSYVAEHPSKPPVYTPGPTGGMHPNHNHGQLQGPDYSQPAPYPQAPHHQNYGQGYNEPRYENQATQYPYGAQGSSHPGYLPAGIQTGYGPPQQYPPSSYGIPSQGTPQSYGTPVAGQPGDMSYQSAVPSSLSYACNVPPQQPYPYVSNVLAQQTYPSYGSATSTDMYNQAQPAVGSAGYSQPAAQAVQSYVQPGVQQAPTQSVPGYGQAPAQPAPAQPTPVYGQPPAQQAPAPGYGQASTQQAPAYAQLASGAYGAYPAVQGYTDQSGNATYVYQGQQDSNYSSAAVPTYNATPTVQAGYTQATQTQLNYDQTGAQSGGYESISGATGVTVSASTKSV